MCLERRNAGSRVRIGAPGSIDVHTCTSNWVEGP